MGELATRRPIMPGRSDEHQLTLIYNLCGTPDDATMPGWNTWGGVASSGSFMRLPPPQGNLPSVVEDRFAL